MKGPVRSARRRCHCWLAGSAWSFSTTTGLGSGGAPIGPRIYGKRGEGQELPLVTPTRPVRTQRLAVVKGSMAGQGKTTPPSLTHGVALLSEEFLQITAEYQIYCRFF